MLFSTAMHSHALPSDAYITAFPKGHQPSLSSLWFTHVSVCFPIRNQFCQIFSLAPQRALRHQDFGHIKGDGIDAKFFLQFHILVKTQHGSAPWAARFGATRIIIEAKQSVHKFGPVWIVILVSAAFWTSLFGIYVNVN